MVEVPLEEKMFTVGGPLGPSAILKKTGKSANLSDFIVGQTVQVRWKPTEKGHVIIRLESR